MLYKSLFKSIIFLSFACSFSVLADDNLPYWIKSHRWDLIDDYFKNRSPRRETEVYSLIEFYDKSHIPNSEKRFLYLISQVKGKFVQSYRKEDIKSIIRDPLPYQSIVFRLSFWKLYKELKKRNILNLQEKIAYLSKLNRDTDPISRQATEELLRVYLDVHNYQAILKLVDSLPSETKRYYLEKEAGIRYAKALFRTGKMTEAMENYRALLQNPSTPIYLRKFAYQDLKKYLSEDAFLNLSLDTIAGVLNQLNSEESKHFLEKYRSSFSQKIDNPENFHQIGHFLASQNKEILLTRFVLANKKHLDSETDHLGSFAMVFYYDKNYREAIRFLENFSDIQEAGKSKALALCYNKLNNDSKKFDHLLEYLQLYPFNLYYQDMLIDHLITSSSNGRKYADKSLWQKAILKIPNLPVKGRLYYWYLRYLKDTGQTGELLRELENYYEKIAGSYYTRVIREEFESELSKLNVPSRPTANKKSLYRYLSHTAGVPEKSGKILKKNLGFAYFEKSFDLGVRLTKAQSNVRSDRMLSLATEYFRLGEDKLGMNLIHFYAKEKNLSRLQKEEILVGVGELSLNYYYSAFYTRSILKRLRIPDDPILLPTTVSLRIYPRPHRDLVRKYARESGIEEEVVYAIMRQESFYKENAVSRSNARGLMQIMPATGRELARKLGVKSYSLFNPDTSIRFGAKFLGYLMRSNENELKWASIAYNGGPGNLRKWKRNHYKGDFNHFLEDIPYKESRDYSRIVVSNYYAYEIMKKYHGF